MGIGLTLNNHVSSCFLLVEESLTVVVHQSGDRLTHTGVTVTLECRRGEGFNMMSYTMYWYRQHYYGAPVEFLIKEYDTTEGHFQSSINTAKNYFSLQITAPHVNDSSTYYCAASHSDAHSQDCHTNTKSLTHHGSSSGLFLFLGVHILTQYISDAYS
uniref:Ig-like domain-containing protein n=1 Tax=Echeneis naucrates TaxID=173247 RepID=A0A665W5F4_ECHNA